MSYFTTSYSPPSTFYYQVRHHKVWMQSQTKPVKMLPIKVAKMHHTEFRGPQLLVGLKKLLISAKKSGTQLCGKSQPVISALQVSMD